MNIIIPCITNWVTTRYIIQTPTIPNTSEFQVQTLFSFPLLRIEKCYYETNYLLGIAFAFWFLDQNALTETIPNED